MSFLAFIVCIVILRYAVKNANEAKRRKSICCRFSDGLTQSEFTTIAHNAAKQIKRLTEVRVDGTIVHGSVRSQSGLSNWTFSLDFNDYGDITGKYWCSTNNNDSSIPKYLGDKIREEIKQRI